MGLAARALEEAGIATTSLSNLPGVTRKVKPPRALSMTSCPRGETVGPPGDADAQRRAVRAALRLLESDQSAAMLVPFKGE